jgi:hypothetical protein
MTSPSNPPGRYGHQVCRHYRDPSPLVIWIHPRSPRLSRLSGCCLGSNPSRVSIWSKAATVNRGPATATRPATLRPRPSRPAGWSCRTRRACTQGAPPGPSPGSAAGPDGIGQGGLGGSAGPDPSWTRPPPRPEGVHTPQIGLASRARLLLRCDARTRTPKIPPGVPPSGDTPARSLPYRWPHDMHRLDEEDRMIPGWWTELAAGERMADLRREAERQRLAHLVGSGRRGSTARRVGSVRWHGWVGRIRAARIRLRRRPPWRGPAFLTQRGDRS